MVGKNSFFLVFLLSDCLVLGLRVVDRVFEEEGFDIFESSVVELSETKEEEVEGLAASLSSERRICLA